MNTIVKIEAPLSGVADTWLLCDQKREVHMRVDPRILPDRVRSAVIMAKRAYFHAIYKGGEVTLGDRVVGNPMWE